MARVTKEVVIREEQSLERRLGELDLNDAVECGVLLDEVLEFEKLIASTRSRLERAIIDRARADGTTEYTLPNRMKAEVRFGTRTTIAADVLEQKLREAGMPEERISEIVTQTVSYRADAAEAKKAARTNEAYAEALKAASTTAQLNPSVSIRRR